MHERLHSLATVASPECGTTSPGAPHGESAAPNGAQVRFGKTEEAVIQRLQSAPHISEIKDYKRL